MSDNDLQERVQFYASEQVRKMLNELKATGLFGCTISGVVDELVRAKLRELKLQGWCGGDGDIDERPM